jgi:rare lipoprotein A
VLGLEQRVHPVAHRNLPLDTKLRVTNLRNGRSVEVTVYDRGPYMRNRLIDLSATAAATLGFKRHGLALMKIEVIPPG